MMFSNTRRLPLGSMPNRRTYSPLWSLRQASKAAIASPKLLAPIGLQLVQEPVRNRLWSTCSVPM